MTRSLDTVTILLVVPSPASVFRRVSVAFGGLWPAINLSSDSVTVTFIPQHASTLFSAKHGMETCFCCSRYSDCCNFIMLAYPETQTVQLICITRQTDFNLKGVSIYLLVSQITLIIIS